MTKIIGPLGLWERAIISTKKTRIQIVTEKKI